jgi:8-oxo-dGTP pyrophosphatase MutT (NUDIX family)
MADDDGWSVAGAAKKKNTGTAKLPKQALRTGESANRTAPSNRKFPANSPSHTPVRSKNPKPKPTFEHRNDDTEYTYDASKLSWTMPAEVFDRILAKFPLLKDLNHQEYHSRWSFMRQMEYAHWFYTDDLIKELADLALKPVSAGDFFAALLQQLVVLGVHPHYSPSRYTDEWQYWQKYCKVGGVAVVRLNPTIQEWEVLMVKNNNQYFSEVSTTWPGGKADMTDTTFWQLASRELREEVSLDVTGDKDKVIAVIEGNRAVSFVLPLPFDDARFTGLKKLPSEIHSILWVPIKSLDLAAVKEPARETRPSDTAALLPKDDPKELRMAWEPKENFRRLQQIDFEVKQEGIDAWLERDPRETPIATSSTPNTPNLRSPQP